MFNITKKIAMAAVVATFAQATFAAEYQVVVHGQFKKDMFAETVFGISEDSVPVQISFIVDDAGLVRQNAGTPVILSSGASFNVPQYLVRKSNIRNFVANIGNATFTEDDLYLQNLGTSSAQYEVLLLGNLTEGGISGVHLTLFGAVGDVYFGLYNCSSSCSFLPYGGGGSYLENTFANIDSVSVTVQSLTPPPSALDLVGSLAKLVTNHKNIKTLQKLAFLIELGIADGFLKKGKTVQAHNTMKAFIVTVKALVKCKTLSASVGDELIAAAEDIIDAM